MHELGIATNILETVASQAERFGGGRPAKVGLRIGDLSGVDKDALDFCFQALVSDSELAPLELEIERIPHRRRCEPCGREFDVDVNRFDASCPACGNLHTDSVTGYELEIAYVEVEDR
jgi:hydrogenase nickel incorporation protein HypA/HybF